MTKISSVIIGNSSAQLKIDNIFQNKFRSVVLNGKAHLGKHSFIKEKLDAVLQPNDTLEVNHTIAGVREVIDFVQLSPLFSAFKAVVFINADQLTEPAQDALLKTLEETPSHARLVFITEDYCRFLPAFQSRLQHIIKWSRLNTEELDQFITYSKLSESVDAKDLCDGRPPFYEMLIRSPVYFKLKDFICNFLDRKVDYDVPEVIKTLKSGSSLERSLVSHICRHSVRPYLTNDLSVSFIRFSALLLSQPAINTEIYWQKTLFNI